MRLDWTEHLYRRGPLTDLGWGKPCTVSQCPARSCSRAFVRPIIESGQLKSDPRPEQENHSGDVMTDALLETAASQFIESYPSVALPVVVTKHAIVAQFRDYSVAHRARCALIRLGIPPHQINIVAGDRSFSHPASRDLGILEEDAESFLPAVRRGRNLLVVQADGTEPARIVGIIEQHAPIEIEEDRRGRDTSGIGR